MRPDTHALESLQRIPGNATKKAGHFKAGPLYLCLTWSVGPVHLKLYHHCGFALRCHFELSRRFFTRLSFLSASLFGGFAGCGGQSEKSCIESTYEVNIDRLAPRNNNVTQTLYLVSMVRSLSSYPNNSRIS